MNAIKLSNATLILGFFWLSSLWTIEAQPVIYQATGTREQVQIVVDQFKHDIVYGFGGSEQNPPSILGSVKTVTFDDIGMGSEITVHSQGEITSSGVILGVPPGSLPLVSAGSTGLNNANRCFGDINSNYTLEFSAFSSPSILAVQNPFGGPGTERILAGPYFSDVRAFGTVFIDVDSPISTSISLWYSKAEDPSVLIPLRLAVPAAPGQGNFSFLGLVLNEGDSIAYGNTTISLPAFLSSGENDSNDMVAVDDIMYGMVPEPSSMLLLITGGLLTWITLRRQKKTRC